MKLLRLLCSLLMILPAIPILPKPHVGRIASLGRTVVHVLNTIPAEQDKLPQELTVTFDGIHSNGKLIAENSFWPANGEQFTIASQQDAVVAEIARTLGIKAQSSYTMTETINLPGVGDVKLVQQISGTKLSSIMQIGLAAPELGIDQQLCNDREWHTVTIAHVNETNKMIGEYRIHYCQHYFGSYLAGLMKGKKTDLQENMAVARRTVWNSLWLAAGAFTAIKVLPDVNNTIKGTSGEKWGLESINKACKSLDIENNILKACKALRLTENSTAQEMQTGLEAASKDENCDYDIMSVALDIANKFERNPNCSAQSIVEQYKADCYDVELAQKDINLMKKLHIISENTSNKDCLARARTALITAAGALKFISNPIVQSAFMLAGLYLVASKPMPYPNVIYIVEYNKN